MRQGLWFLLLIVLISGPVFADTLHMANGNTVQGRLVSEGEDEFVINTGIIELNVPRGQVERVERALPAGYVVLKGETVLRNAATQSSRGNTDTAVALIDQFLDEIDEIETEYPEAELPEDADTIRTRLRETRRSLIGADRDLSEGEVLYQQGLNRLDRVDYQEAFDLFQQALEASPGRTDIALELARTAERLNRRGVAIENYKLILDEEPEIYYDEVARTLLELLELEATTLLSQRRTDPAVDVYRDILILKGSGESAVPDVEEYLARRTTREEQTEDEVLLEVYQYADDADLVDLAFAAIIRVEKLRPEDEEIAKLVTKSRYLSELDTLVSDGDAEGAAELIQRAREELPDVAEFEERAGKLTEGIERQIEAENLVAEARAAFEAGNYEEAAEKAREAATEYEDMAVASEARRILTNAEREIPIRDGYDRAQGLLDDREYDETIRVLEEVTTLDGFDDSRYRARVTAMLSRVPDEREADRLYDLARMQLEREDYTEALARLEEIVSRYPNTISGREAAEWLSDYRARLRRESDKTRLVATTSFFDFANPSLWRAAEYEVPNRRRLAVAPVMSEMKQQAWDTFHALRQRDVPPEQEGPNVLLAYLLPGVLGLAGAGALTWQMLGLGKGHLPREREDSSDTSETACHVCGQQLPEKALTCPACGQLCADSEVEESRKSSDAKKADFDPWDIRVRTDSANDFDKYYAKARELSETSDVQAAIEQCRLALHEDPLRKKGYELLASLYERANLLDEAIRCYREILLIDPADVNTRQKVESLLSLSGAPLDGRPMIIGCSALLWWAVFFVTLAVDMQQILLRLGLCIAGGILTVLYWERVLKRKKRMVRAERGQIRPHRDLPAGRLSFREQRRQALRIASAIHDHTGLHVPVLTPWRPVIAAGASAVLLAGLMFAAIAQETWLVLLAWPAGAALLYFVIEVYPRAFTAHVILRHIYEETSSPWVDPHRPFEPRDEPVKGEFLIRRPDEFPLRWALRPFPYSFDRQGVLNSLQQTLNRHWAFHRFYGGAQVVRDTDMPLPCGTKTTTWSLGLLFVIALAGGAAAIWSERSLIREYDESLELGYGYLLDGDIARATEELNRAGRVDGQRVLPQLYLAHANAAAGMMDAAERAYANAMKRPVVLAEAANDFGNFLQREGRLRDAARQYELALSLSPRNADIMNNLGSVQFKLKDYEAAVATLTRAVEIRRDHTRAHTTLGLAQEALGRYEDARNSYQVAVTVAPDVEYTRIARDRLAIENLEDMGQPIRLERVAPAAGEEPAEPATARVVHRPAPGADT